MSPTGEGAQGIGDAGSLPVRGTAGNLPQQCCVILHHSFKVGRAYTEHAVVVLLPTAVTPATQQAVCRHVSPLSAVLQCVAAWRDSQLYNTAVQLSTQGRSKYLCPCQPWGYASCNKVNRGDCGCFFPYARHIIVCLDIQGVQLHCICFSHGYMCCHPLLLVLVCALCHCLPACLNVCLPAYWCVFVALCLPVRLFALWMRGNRCLLRAGTSCDRHGHTSRHHLRQQQQGQSTQQHNRQQQQQQQQKQPCCVTSQPGSCAPSCGPVPS
jgi:hypothetical protein